MNDKVFAKRILWIGFHEEGRHALASLLEKGVNVIGLITLTEDAAAKRSGVFDYSQITAKYNIPSYAINHINDASSVELIRSLMPDVLCVIGWRQILSPDVLSTADLTIGAHASFLPKNRGSAPINWSIIKGESSTGNTLIKLTEGVDEGDILSQREFEITEFDSCSTLYDKVAKTNASMLLEVLQSYEYAKIVCAPQKDNREDLLPRRRPQDGLMDWNNSARQLYDFVRALTTPYPGAFFYLRGIKVTVWVASLSSLSCEAGEVGAIVGRRASFEPSCCGVEVRCGLGALTLHDVEINGVGRLTGESLVRYFDKESRVNV